MTSNGDKLRDDALRIWKAAVRAVKAERLMHEQVHRAGSKLKVCDEMIDLGGVRRIVAVGAGKASAAMASALEEILGDRALSAKRLEGWINVPANCVEPLQRIHLHPARPAEKNEPTADGVVGTLEILRLVESLGPRDLCFCLISGGGSALLPAPVPGISLEDKQAVTRFLSAAGANIAELNVVRKQLSRVKGGGLARACRAGRMITLVISDVLGDPLDVIASGPTVVDRSTPDEALAVLDKFAAQGNIPDSIFEAIRRRKDAPPPAAPTCVVSHHILGNVAAAVDAAGMEAERLGYSHAMQSAARLEGEAEQIGRHLADMASSMRNATSGPNCLISGGEPVVRLVEASRRGMGGRNQQLVLAALARLVELQGDAQPAADGGEGCEAARGVVILSGGTDGEDGPTDAAGALVDQSLLAEAMRLQLDPRDFLARNDAYRFFDAVGGLIKTGPTHTNVCDVRVVLAAR